MSIINYGTYIKPFKFYVMLKSAMQCLFICDLFYDKHMHYYFFAANVSFFVLLSCFQRKIWESSQMEAVKIIVALTVLSTGNLIGKSKKLYLMHFSTGHSLIYMSEMK